MPAMMNNTPKSTITLPARRNSAGMAFLFLAMKPGAEGA